MIRSTQRSLYIRFKTDASVSNMGFTAAYDKVMDGKSSLQTAWYVEGMWIRDLCW